MSVSLEEPIPTPDGETVGLHLAPEPLAPEDKKVAWQQWALTFIIVAPLLAMGFSYLAAQTSVLALTWPVIVISVVFYLVSGLGITVGYHRYLTHGGFRAKLWLRVALAVAGSLAIEGPPIRWVADHRRHHKFSDKEGDPHSPWKYGRSWKVWPKGFFWAHMGWLFDPAQSSRKRFAPDLLADPAIRRVESLFPAIAVTSVVAPGLLSGLVTWSWQGLLAGLFWGGLVRIGFLHHVTWFINSLCHMWRRKPYVSRDDSRNVGFPLSVLSFGESWHNYHHAEPTSPRHGTHWWEVDLSAYVIWMFQKLGWATHVKWPSRESINQKRINKKQSA